MEHDAYVLGSWMVPSTMLMGFIPRSYKITRWYSGYYCLWDSSLYVVALAVTESQILSSVPWLTISVH